MENQGTKIQKEKTQFGCLIIIMIVITLLFFMFSSSSEDTTKSQREPDDIELMSYAQLVLKDNLNNPSYSSFKDDYTFIKTNLRYKIEGNVTINNSTNKFYMIIEFVDNTYKEYDLISLQVGNDIIYKK